MKIEITSEAEQYIAQNGNDVVIMKGITTSCCGGAATMPNVSLGRPKDCSLYNLRNYNNINLFVDKQIAENSSISISLSKLLWFNSLYVELIEKW